MHSIENGVLVGPGGPLDPIPGANNYPRPPKQVGGGFYRPGPSGYQGQPGNFGVGGHRGKENSLCREKWGNKRIFFRKSVIKRKSS